MTVRYLTNQEEVEARGFMLQAVAQAHRALCLRAKCGTVIVKNGEVIGFGYNAPPLDRADQQMCLKEFGVADKPKYDRTCCLHAEWRAILDALKRYPDQVSGARLYLCVSMIGEMC